MASKLTPITFCTCRITYHPSSGYGTFFSAMNRRMTSRGCAKAERLTTAPTSSCCDACSSAAAAPTECPISASRCGSMSGCKRNHARPAAMSSAKRGIDVKLSSSLSPWQRASISKTAKPAACRGGITAPIIEALAPQPCITSTAGTGCGKPGDGETIHPNKFLPRGPAIRTSRPASQATPCAAAPNVCGRRGARRPRRMAAWARLRSSHAPANAADVSMIMRQSAPSNSRYRRRSRGDAAGPSDTARMGGCGPLCAHAQAQALRSAPAQSKWKWNPREIQRKHGGKKPRSRNSASTAAESSANRSGSYLIWLV